MISPVNWERMEDNFSYSMYRMRVPGGWLIRCENNVNTKMHDDQQPMQGYEWRQSIAFVPDPKHKWRLD